MHEADTIYQLFDVLVSDFYYYLCLVAKLLTFTTLVCNFFTIIGTILSVFFIKIIEFGQKTMDFALRGQNFYSDKPENSDNPEFG